MTRSFSTIALLILLAACQRETPSDDLATTTSPAPSTPTERNVCDLLTMDDLKTGAGLDSAAGESSRSGGADVCTWSSDGGKIVVVQVFPSASSYDRAREAFQSQYGGTAEEVPNLGEKAFYIPGTTGGMPTGTLVAQRGSTPVSVQVMGGTSDPAARKGEAIALAHVLLGRL